MCARLIADIGATYARFAIAAAEQKIEHMKVYKTCECESLFEAVRHYLNDPILHGVPRPTQAALAIAAPISGDRVVMMNKEWSFSHQALEAELGVKVRLYNDFLAVALGIPYLHPNDDKLVLGEAVPESDGPIAVIGPGSGLGVAGLIHTVDGWINIASEGGHATIAAATREESQVLDLLRLRWGHVSAERVLSGPGLENLYDALCTVHGVVSSKVTAKEITTALLKPEVTHAHSPCPLLCAKAFEFFCDMLGTVAGNLALTLGATAGVYIAGGILPRVKDQFAASNFRNRFEQKGRLTPYMKSIPTYLLLHPAPALLGLVHEPAQHRVFRHSPLAAAAFAD
jgi:glucokinase